MKKFIKLIMIMFIILGIVFSVSNFISVDIRAHSDQGIDIDGECISVGWQCDLSEVE